MTTTELTTTNGNHRPEPREGQTDARAFAAPPVDVFESNEAFLIVADLPGVEAPGVKLDLDREHLTLEASRADQALDYRRRFDLAVPVDADQVSARLENGVLRVEIPKAAEARPRTIPVHAG